MNDNKRYLGDVFINAENKEIQAQFFKDIIESYQGKLDGTFNAFSLWDEKSQTEKFASDFATAEQGRLADNSLQSPIRIGRKNIANIEDKQYIYTDATLLDSENQNLMDIDWFSDLSDTSLSNVLIAIRDAIEIINSALQESIDEIIINKLDTSAYNTFYDTDYEPFKTTISSVLAKFEDEHGDEITKLDADMVNGLRFRLITQEKYDELDAAEKNYWRNIFIIKDASEIPPDYVDPMQWGWEDGYTFQVHDGYLQFNNGLSTEWKNICSLEELLTGGSVANVVQDILANQAFDINGESISQSLLNIEPSTVDENWNNYPFLSSSLHDDYIESIKINNASDYVTTTINPSSKFKIVNLDIDGIIANALTDIQDSIFGANGIQSQLSTVQTNIRSLQGGAQSQITLNQGFANDIDNLSSQISQLNNNLSALNVNLASINDWKTVNIPGLKWVSNGATYQSYCMYNDKLKLAHIYLSFGMYIGTDNLNKDCDVRKSKNSYEAYYAYAKPHSNSAYYASASSPLDFVKIKPDGRINVYSTRSKAPNSLQHILASWTYKYSGKSDYY